MKTKLAKLFNSCTFDVEYGNSISFYSASKSQNHNTQKKNAAFHFNLFGRLEKTELRVTDELKIIDKELVRETSFLALSDSILFDLVSRFVVRSDEPLARINGYDYRHSQENLYYQYEVKEDSLVEINTSHGKLIFEPKIFEPPKGFKQVIYIRDEKQEDGSFIWIVHHRVIADENMAKLVFRCCHPKLEGVVKFQQFIPKYIKRKFFRIRERKYPNCPFMSVSEAILKKGYILKLITKLSVEE